jgi:hypothetical protein
VKTKSEEILRRLGKVEESQDSNTTKAMADLLVKYNRATYLEVKLNILCAMVLTSADENKFANDINELLR